MPKGPARGFFEPYEAVGIGACNMEVEDIASATAKPHPSKGEAPIYA